MSESDRETRTTFDRREFLSRFAAIGGCFVATASPLLISCGKEPRPGGAYRFPQGVASADPQSEGVVLWTRAIRAQGDETDIPLRLHVARDASFRNIVLETEVRAESAFDFTVRCFVDGLEHDRHYAYRFIAPDGTPSLVGRTRTAPSPETMRPLNVAVFSCQHYNDGFFSAYRRLLLDDATASPEHKIDLVVHVGDYIYEYLDPIIPEIDGQAFDLRDRNGARRSVRPLPSGEGSDKSAAETLDDYRHLYRTYISDPDLMAARAAFPFVHIWDDHEIVNDYWQSYAKAGPMQRRKVDANQAWFEYLPALLTGADPGPVDRNQAHDFVRAEVEDRPPEALDDLYLAREPNNLAAIGVISIYRSLRWGRLVDLFAVDGRSYRGERGVDDALLEGTIAAYPLAPVRPETVEMLNAGRTANGGRPPLTVLHQGREFENPRRNAPVGSLLGSEQKAWLKMSLEESGAVWKLILNDVPLMRFGFDVSFRAGEPENGLFWTDSWDGYPIERRELMSFIQERRIANVVSFTGDRHAHFAGLVYDDYDGVAPQPVLPEFACASVSAIDRAMAHGLVLGHEPDLKPLFAFDGRPFGYESPVVPSLNAWLLYGAPAARLLSETGDAGAASLRAKPTINPHLQYADTDAYGYFVARVRETEIEVEFVTIPAPHIDHGLDGPPVLRRVRYRVHSWKPGETPILSTAEVEGAPPLLGIRSD